MVVGTGNTGTDFSVDGSSGAISVVNAVSKTRTPSYTLQVTATDGGSSPRTATATLTITVGDSSGGSGGSDSGGSGGSGGSDSGGSGGSDSGESGGSDSDASVVASSIYLIGITMFTRLF